jgi:hypothetical protein
MNRTAEYSAATGVPIDRITHCVLVGTRHGREVWAIGYRLRLLHGDCRA